MISSLAKDELKTSRSCFPQIFLAGVSREEGPICTTKCPLACPLKWKRVSRQIEKRQSCKQRPPLYCVPGNRSGCFSVAAKPLAACMQCRWARVLPSLMNEQLDPGMIFLAHGQHCSILLQKTPSASVESSDRFVAVYPSVMMPLQLCGRKLLWQVLAHHIFNETCKNRKRVLHSGLHLGNG